MDVEIGSDESVSTAVLRAVSTVKGREPDSLPPLTGVIDPGALDTLFDPRSNGVIPTGVGVSFTYSGCRITIDSGTSLAIEADESAGRRPAQTGGSVRGATSHSDRDVQQTATDEPPGSLVCFVCQQPLQRENLHHERGEWVHSKCHPELRCGITIQK